MVELKNIINDKYVLTVDNQKIFISLRDLRSIFKIINSEFQEEFTYKNQGD